MMLREITADLAIFLISNRIEEFCKNLKLFYENNFSFSVVFHVNHYLATECKMLLVLAFWYQKGNISDEDLTFVRKCCKELIELLKVVAPIDDKTKGIFKYANDFETIFQHRLVARNLLFARLV